MAGKGRFKLLPVPKRAGQQAKSPFWANDRIRVKVTNLGHPISVTLVVKSDRNGCVLGAFRGTTRTQQFKE